jgi:AcrR family transcriptional regulator
MDPAVGAVKPRSYDASRRRAEAARTRDRVLDAAEQLFLERGYAATTVAAVASNAGVSTELIYKTLGGKAGMVREIQARGLLGAGPVPAPARSDAVAATDIDARTLLHEWSRFTIEVSPRTAPILILVRAAAAHDAELADLLAEMTAQHLERMALNARRLLAHPGLRPGLSADRVRDVLWTYTSPELYDRLVGQRGWSLDDYADFVFRGMCGQLLAGG